MQMDPRPDFSDPMPGGCLWLGNAGVMTAYPDRDLGLVIMSDDDGLITDLFARFTGGTNFSSVSSVGQTFIARGVSLISAAFWVGDRTYPSYAVRLLQAGPACAFAISFSGSLRFRAGGQTRKARRARKNGLEL